jgi:outer membrane protein assembly factor BamA
LSDPSIEERFSEPDTPGLNLQPGFWHAGAFATFDNRDHYGIPHAGGSYQFRWTYFGDRDLGRFSFRRYDLDLRQYFPLRDKLDTVAVRGLVTFTDRNRDQAVPFYMQPTVGGGNDLRGFSQSRFRGDNAIVLNLEYRREISPYFDLIAFGDAGKVFARAGDLGLRGLEGAAGGGGRLKFRETVLFGFDLGWSREGPRLWLRASHVF